jgi:hypothetical protein
MASKVITADAPDVLVTKTPVVMSVTNLFTNGAAVHQT